MADLAALKVELDTDPLVRGYSGMNDAAASVDINLFNRNADASIDELREYFILERKNRMFLIGRLEVVAAGTVGADPLGDTVTLTLEHITAAKAMITALKPASEFNLDLTDSRFDQILDDLAAGAGCKCIGSGDKTALQALSQNQQSRASELNLGNVREGTVAQARSL